MAERPGDGLEGSLKGVYTAATVTAAEIRFAEFAATWRGKYPAMVAMGERSWPEFVPFLDFPLPVRKLIFATNGIGSLNSRFARPSGAGGTPQPSTRRWKSSTSPSGKGGRTARTRPAGSTAGRALE